MAWVSPMTAVIGGSVRAADFNQYIRDNLLETGPGKSTKTGSWFPSSGVNQISERTPTGSEALGSSTTTATSYGNLADAVTTSVTVTTGTFALVILYTNFNSNAVGNRIWTSYAVSGATTSASSDSRALHHSFNGGQRYGGAFLQALTSGSNTFTMQYRVTAGTGTFSVRRIAVIPF